MKITLKPDADLESYHSSDRWDDDRPINLAPGESADVSAEKAAQVAEDFPDLFDVEGAEAAEAAEREAAEREAAEAAEAKPKPKRANRKGKG